MSIQSTQSSVYGEKINNFILVCFTTGAVQRTILLIPNEAGGLNYEVDYAYDRQNNYLKMVPPHLYNPINWSANNVTVASLSDYTGLIDASCYRFVTTYQYNQDGYPVEVIKDWGTKLRLTYK